MMSPTYHPKTTYSVPYPDNLELITYCLPGTACPFLVP